MTCVYGVCVRMCVECWGVYVCACVGWYMYVCRVFVCVWGRCMYVG